MTLTLAGVTRSAQSKTYWLHFLACLFAKWDEIWEVMEYFKLNILILLFSELFVVKGNNRYFLLTAFKTLTLACIQTVTNQLGWNISWWKILPNSRFWYQFMWPWLWFKVTGMRENENVCTIYIWKFSMILDGIWSVVETALVLMNLILILSPLICVQEREPSVILSNWLNRLGWNLFCCYDLLASLSVW